MAFNFFGTFTRAQWYDFRDFISVQRTELEARSRWLKAELTRTGQVECAYADDGTPLSFTASSKSYIGKLLLAYRMLGGIPENDMLLRTRDQVVFLNRGIDQDDRPRYSNQRVNRGSQRFDRSLGLAVEDLKKWQLEAIKVKREHLEFKIKRALDYADQLQQEYDMISSLTGFAVDDQIMRVETTIEEPGRFNVPSGVGDRHGLGVGPPGDFTDPNAPFDSAAENQRVPQGSG